VRVPAAGLAILTAETVPTFIELDQKKFGSYLKHENLNNVLKWREAHGETNKPGRERYSKYVKSLIQAGKSDEHYRERTGLTIELIPEADPYSLRPGATLPVQVLFRGSPAVDVAVESAWLEGGKSKMEIVGRTDGNGRVRVPVKATGPYRLHAIVMERCAEPTVADWESFWASLTFEIQSGR
jgi:5-hydroxyisourate hydrolase-like protein (transthyretin family)